MRRYRYKKYLFILFVLFFLLSIPSLVIEKVRIKLFRLFSPGWELASFPVAKREEARRLESENQLLRMEISRLRALLEQNSLMISTQKLLQHYNDDPKRYSQYCFLLGNLAKAVPAQVIYRDPSSWTSSLWINVGSKTNEYLNLPIIAKNSPVVYGRAVVGVIDYVGKKQSRVRLISDSGLNPSVRAVRGYPQNIVLSEHVDALLRALNNRTDLRMPAKEKQDLTKYLNTLNQQLFENCQEWHLAKGILQGSSKPLWRSVGTFLKGIGFNYDFADEEGPSCELTAGKITLNSCSVPILKVNDLLITTGMDGVFPVGLPVAEITKVHVLKEGNYAYEIEAKPIVGNMDELHVVFVLPPIGFESYE